MSNSGDDVIIVATETPITVIETDAAPAVTINATSDVAATVIVDTAATTPSVTIVAPDVDAAAQVIVAEAETIVNIITEAEPEIHVIESISLGPQGPPGPQGIQGPQGEPGGGSSNPGYNFIETVPASDTAVTTETISITIKTMRHLGVSTQVPTLTINDVAVTPSKVTGDENIYSYSFTPALTVGDNVYVITSDNGVELEKILTINRIPEDPSCTLTHSSFLKAGSYSIGLTTDYDLISTPTLSCSLGSLSAFTGSGKTWAATLTITDENGAGTFSDAVLEGSGGTGSMILSGTTYFVDTIAPTIGENRNFSITLWHYENGVVSITIPMGESTSGFTGYIDLSAFGLSANYSLQTIGSSMIASFTPSRVDAGPAYGTNIRVSDQCGNAATNNGLDTNNQLQVIAYRIKPETVTFPSYNPVSNALSGGQSFLVDANAQVQWGSDQTETGMLSYGEDYVIDDHNTVHLDEDIWVDVIAANALGLLHVTIWEN
jgi:hypothetical protein